MTDVSFITAGGTGKLHYGVDRQTILQPALALIHHQFQPGIAAVN